jgi:hypothetical protein
MSEQWDVPVDKLKGLADELSVICANGQSLITRDNRTSRQQETAQKGGKVFDRNSQGAPSTTGNSTKLL